MTTILNESEDQDIDRLSLMKHQQMLTHSIETLWRDVQAGKVAVESVALLRAMRDVTIYDLNSKLQSPQLDYRRITREVKLLENSIKHILRPVRIR
ncbi:MAG: hypothetical protein ACE5H4_08475 [Candidatus Thorarchaeota archaeon]